MAIFNHSDPIVILSYARTPMGIEIYVPDLPARMRKDALRDRKSVV